MVEDGLECFLTKIEFVPFRTIKSTNAFEKEILILTYSNIFPVKRFTIIHFWSDLEMESQDGRVHPS